MNSYERHLDCQKRYYQKDPAKRIKASLKWRDDPDNRKRYNELQRGYMLKRKIKKIMEEAELAKQRKAA